MEFNDRSYKIAFLVALSLHSLVAGLLFCKVTSDIKQPVLAGNFNIVKATLVTNDVEAEIAKIKAERLRELKLQQERARQLAVQRKIAQATAVLQKRLAAEQQHEQQAIKKKIQREKTALTKAKQQALHKLMQQQLAQEKNQLAKAAKAVSQHNANGSAGNAKNLSEIARYKALIVETISQVWIIPDGVDKDAACVLLITLAPGGNVIDVKLQKSSGNAALDRSAKTAVLKASPLPVPKSAALFNHFRTIRLTVHPKDMEYQN